MTGQPPLYSNEQDAYETVSSYDKVPPTSTWLAYGRRGLQVLLPVAAIGLAIATYNYLKATKPEARKQAPQEAVFSVKSIPVSFSNHQPRLTLYGTTVAGREVELRSLVAGRVVQTGGNLQAGGRVKTGDLLIAVDPFDYRIAISEAEAQLAEAKARLVETEASRQVEKGNLKSAQAQLKLARTDLSRAVPLARKGTVSERTVDDRRLIALQRQQAVTQSENNLRVWEARKAQHTAAVSRLEQVLERAKRRLGETKLKAPFNAYVADVGAQIGRMLSVNDRVATLIDRDWIDVRFTLTDGQFGRVSGGEQGLVGRAIEVRWNAGRKAIVYAAKIERIDGRVTADTGGIQVYARVTNPQDPITLRSGVFVEVRLPDATFEQVAKVPSEAVYDGKTVYVIDNGRLKRRNVAIVGTSGQDLLIEGNLKQGERIVVTRLARPGDGVRVKERTSNDA